MVGSSPATKTGGGGASGSSSINLQQTPKSRTKSQAKTTESPNTPKSEKSRSTWCPVIVKEGGSYDIMIKIKTAIGNVGLFSDSGPASKSRSTWEAAVDFQMAKVVKANESVDYVDIRNIENQQKKFRPYLLNMFIDSPSQFNRFCTKFVVDKNVTLLCKYFTLLARSKGFTLYVAEDFTEDGFRKDDSGYQEQDLVISAGSLTEYLEFSSLARIHCTVCGEGTNNGTASRRGKNKRITEFFQTTCPPRKMTKVEKVNTDFRKSCVDKDGVEQALVSSYVGWKKITLDKLKVCENIFITINEEKVQALAASMSARFDPALAVITVMEDKDSKDGSYFVLHGNHRLLAFKQLSTLGKFSLLPGIVDEKLVCHVVGSGVCDPAVGIYAQIRGNDLASEHQTHAVLHELIYVFQFLKKSYKNDHEKAIEVVVERMCKLRRIGRDETTHLRKILNWPENQLEMLIKTLKLYESYQTVDTSGKRIQEKIKRGEKLKLTKDMFKNIAKCSPAFFEANYKSVTGGEMSLKTLLIESGKAEMILKTKSMIAMEANYESFETLQLQFPEKLSNDVVETFIGAQTMGKNSNMKGVMLKNYMIKIKKPESQSQKVHLKTEVLENILDFDQQKLDLHETVVIHMNKDCQEYMDYIIDTVSLSMKGQFAVLVLFEEEKDCRQALVKLDYWEKEGKIKIVQVLFENPIVDLNEDGSIDSNVIFSVIFGKFCVTKPPLKKLNKTLDSSLFDVIFSISPPGARIAYITAGQKFPVMMPNDDSTMNHTVTYFAPKMVLDKLEMKGVTAGTVDILDAHVADMEDVPVDGPGAVVVENEESDDIFDLSKEKKLEKQSSTSNTKYA